jgi:hypothetical protein
MKETEESQSFLAAHLPAEEPLANRGAVQKASEAAPEMTSLDQRHESVLRELLGRPSWSPAELRVVTSKVGLMSWACVDTINKWALNTHGEVLLEGEPITVNQDIKQKIQV